MRSSPAWGDYLCEQVRRSRWRRNARGNLWRRLRATGLLLTVFRKGDWWVWSVRDREGVRYSRERYDSEDEAQSAVMAEVGL